MPGRKWLSRVLLTGSIVLLSVEVSRRDLRGGDDATRWTGDLIYHVYADSEVDNDAQRYQRDRNHGKNPAKARPGAPLGTNSTSHRTSAGN